MQIEENDNADGTPAADPSELERTREELRVATFQTKELREIVAELQAELDEGADEKLNYLNISNVWRKSGRPSYSKFRSGRRRKESNRPSYLNSETE